MAVLQSTLRIGLIDAASRPLRALSAQLGAFRAQNRAMMAPVTGTIARIAAFGGAYVGVTQGIRATAGAALGLESAMSDVRKVVDATNEQFAMMKRDVVGLSKVMPVTAEGFASIYAAAAQSGIANNELKRFAEGVVRVSTAWDTTVDATGESLAKIKTALGRDIDQTMSLADAINHVSNVSAASAPDMLDFTNRVAAFAETAGFSAEQALAFGGAMVGSGFEPEVAATSFRNLTKALTIGTKATKAQRVAMKSLGLDAVKTAKGMQTNAVATTLDVLDKIKKLPEWQQISVASALFGDEARGLAPLFRNADELRRLLRETGDAANYSGSAFKEYVTRADTVGNVLQITKNKVAAVFEQMGEGMLPALKDAALGVGHVLDTLGERAGVFDKIGAGLRGFVDGMGFKGGVREAVEGLGDLLFGKVDGGGAADQIGAMFVKFREYGKSVRELYDALKDNPVAQFFAQMAGQGFKLFVAAAAIGAVASAIMKLARAAALLTGLTTAVSIIKTLGSVGSLLTTAGAGAGTTAATAAGAAAIAAPAAGVGLWSRLFGSMGAAVATAVSLNAAQSDLLKTHAEQERMDAAKRHIQESFEGREKSDVGGWRRFLWGDAADPNFRFRDSMRIDRGNNGSLPALPQKGQSLPEIIKTQPTGVQDVKVTNPPPQPVVPVSVTVYATTNASPDEIGAAVGAKVKGVIESHYMDSQ